MRYSNHFCKLRAELQAYAKTTFKLAPSGKRGSLGLEWLEGLLYQTPGTFSQHTLLEALIVTGGSPPYFGEQYRDLLLNLYRKLDENNSSSTRWYTVMWHQILYFLLFATKERSSTERRMEGGIADETSMRHQKCECLGSAAYGQLPSWVHTDLTASTVNAIRCQT